MQEEMVLRLETLQLCQVHAFAVDLYRRWTVERNCKPGLSALNVH